MLYSQSYVRADIANGSQSSLLLNLEAVSILFRMWLAVRSTRIDWQNETYLPILIKASFSFSYYISVVKFICEIKKNSLQIKYLESQDGTINTKRGKQGKYTGYKIAITLQLSRCLGFPTFEILE